MPANNNNDSPQLMSKATWINNNLGIIAAGIAERLDESKVNCVAFAAESLTLQLADWQVANGYLAS
jgi:hypothetical protein